MATLKNLVNETTNIKNDIVTCHSSIIEKLNNKGIDAKQDEKLLSLINKIGNITLESLGGMKYATGTYPRPAGGNGYHDIRGMSFKPSYFIAVQPYGLDKYHVYTINHITGSKCYRTDTGDNGTSSGHVTNCLVYDDGYGINMAYSNYDTTWIAFG